MTTPPTTMPKLSAVRDRLLRDDHLTEREKHLVLDQVQALIDNVYVHRPHKSAMYGINAGQQLRLLRRRQSDFKGAAFHYELLRILDGLRDMHTTYVLPAEFHRLVLLGIVLERCWTDDKPKYLVSKINTDLVKDSRLRRGVEVVHWNGMPIQAAVERNAESEAGGNPAARLACGLESLTLRSLAQSPLPAEDWVELGCRNTEKSEEWLVRLDWRVNGEPAGLTASADDRTSEGRRLGLSQRTETARETKLQFFTGEVSKQEVVPEKQPPADGLTVTEIEIETCELKNEVRARTYRTSDGAEYGYLRIFTFHTELPVEDFLKEVRELLGSLPGKGLIVDVRGNGGGYIYAAEAMLQYLTDTPIRPEPMQFISSDLTHDLCRRVPELAQWRRSLSEAGATGEQYSAALPLYSAEEINRTGRAGPERPVILVTDALCYSATDMFAAGFQDHGIGHVLGVDDNTGAGGANRWTLDDFLVSWPDGPFRALPRGARLYIALRRSLRVGNQAGRPVEDLGVRPDVFYRMTEDDLLYQNQGLVRRAITILEHDLRATG